MVALVAWLLALAWLLVGHGWLLGDLLRWSPPAWAVWGPLVALLLLDALRRLTSSSHTNDVQRPGRGGSEQ